MLTAVLGRELAADGISVRAADPGRTRRTDTGQGDALWMRLFYGIPGARQRCPQDLRRRFDRAWTGQTGVFVTGGKAATLPPDLTSERFQNAFLRQCRARIEQHRQSVSKRRPGLFATYSSGSPERG